MNGYEIKSVACEQAGITKYKLNRLVSEGKVRFFNTRLLPTMKEVCLIKVSDIFDAEAGKQLEWLALKELPTRQVPITQNAVRYHIERGRFRWMRQNYHIYVCLPDLLAFLTDDARKPRGRANPMFVALHQP